MVRLFALSQHGPRFNLRAESATRDAKSSLHRLRGEAPGESPTHAREEERSDKKSHRMNCDLSQGPALGIPESQGQHPSTIRSCIPVEGRPTSLPSTPAQDGMLRLGSSADKIRGASVRSLREIRAALLVGTRTLLLPRLSIQLLLSGRASSSASSIREVCSCFTN